MADYLSDLAKERAHYRPPLPSILQQKNLNAISIITQNTPKYTPKVSEEVLKLFPHIAKQENVQFQEVEPRSSAPLTVGVVLSGGQASGGHNVIVGLYDALIALNPASRLIGFCNGPSGIVEQRTKILDKAVLAPYRNQGGFDLIGSGRTKIETAEQFHAAQKCVEALQLDGLVIVGGDDSNTNAALLAEFFQANDTRCKVIGVPKTIDGDLKNEFIEISFGFDTACKVYSETISNIERDAISAKKYYFFVKLMGRSASHVTLECALQTHPNMALIGEEIQKEGKTVHAIVLEIADMICARSAAGKDYGVILIPEGIIEFVPEFKQLIAELNRFDGQVQVDYASKMLTKESKACFAELPADIQSQLLLDRDPHGNIQVSKIETDRLFMHLVERELNQRKQKGAYKGKFNAQAQFCGYEGRAGMPTNFDSQYCYTLGYVATLLIQNGCTGYMSCVQNLIAEVGEWQIGGVPLINMMGMELRHGKMKPVIKKALVDLSGKPFRTFQEQRKQWMLEDHYRYCGPIQFFGPSKIADARTITLELESKN